MSAANAQFSKDSYVNWKVMKAERQSQERIDAANLWFRCCQFFLLVVGSQFEAFRNYCLGCINGICEISGNVYYSFENFGIIFIHGLPIQNC